MVFNGVKPSKWSSTEILNCPSFLFASRNRSSGSRSSGIGNVWQRCFGSPLIVKVATFVDFSKGSYAREQALIYKSLSYFSNIDPSRFFAELLVHLSGIPQTRYVFSTRIGDGLLAWRAFRADKRRQDKVNNEVRIAVIIVVTKIATNKSDMILPSAEPRLSKLLLEVSYHELLLKLA